VFSSIVFSKQNGFYAMNSKEILSTTFPFGTHLCREPMPSITELKFDMEILKKHGFNLVKLQEHWMIDEPVEGRYDFSRYEELIEYAGRLDMGVYLGLTCEQAPGWLYNKHPSCRMVGRNGVPIVYEAQTTLPADGKPGPCYDHPGALADQKRFITALVNCLGRFENLVVWNTWQEIGYWSVMTAGQPVCYCEHTLEAFRCWLKQRYDDLDGLNLAWKARYRDWQHVQPDRGAYQQNGLPQDVDWRYFMDNVQTSHVLVERTAAIKSADPSGRPVFAHKGGINAGYGHDWIYARTQDFLGSSCYPAWNPYHPWDDGFPQQGMVPERVFSLINEMVHGVAFTFDTIRSCNRPGAPLWAAEFQGGPISTFLHKGRIPSPADIRRWLLTAVSCGVTGVSFWVTRAEIMAQEANGFSLLDSEGNSTLRLEEAARIGAAFNRHADIFGQPSWFGAKVAILVNEWNAQLCSTIPPAVDHLAYSTRGWHRLLWELGIPADFVDICDLDLKESDYKVLILPFPLSISEKAANSLVHYVQNGGYLISEVAPGRLSEHAIATRGELSPILKNLFGIRHQSITVVREPGASSRWTPVERTWGEFLDNIPLQGTGPLLGLSIDPSLYIETYDPVISQVLVTFNNQVAGVENSLGEGKAILLGTCLGHHGDAYRSRESINFIRALLAHCGITPLHEGRLLMRKRAINSKTALFLTNPTGEEITESILVGQATVEDLLGEPIQVEDDHMTISVGSLDVRVIILHSFPGEDNHRDRSD
jgi:beta-galactosidase